jgi:Lrp/AsnC family transcriptional regulator, leucine-responsive regulatory protein
MSEQLDDIDQAILDRLRDDAREPAASIAAAVGLSPAAVRRRIARLEDQKVIVRYTVVLDHDQVGPSLEAYVELHFTATTDVQAFLSSIVKLPEVREASTLAGHPDALVRLRIRDVDHLREVVTSLRRLRKHGEITSTKTLVALGRLRHVSERYRARR